MTIEYLRPSTGEVERQRVSTLDPIEIEGVTFHATGGGHRVFRDRTVYSFVRVA
ncbi:hypothetical protein [Cellulomonas septica]|uniref:hypothetical protein n=1 Tax=Cellulomonas septica TaxID=285080 RepID=UPI00144543B7|nr:hypothetical protein [Cellulomonas septica]